MRGALLVAFALLVPTGLGAWALASDPPGQLEGQGFSEDPEAAGHDAEPPGDEPAEDPPSHEEGLCIPSCEIGASAFRFMSPTTIVEANTTVTWTSDDGGFHTVTSTDPDYDTPATGSCLNKGLAPNAPATGTFRLANGTLESRSIKIVEDDQGEEREVVVWTPCPEAVGQADGSFVLHYICTVHPGLQRGQLVITLEL